MLFWGPHPLYYFLLLLSRGSAELETYRSDCMQDHLLLISLPSPIPNVATIPVPRKEGDRFLSSWLLTTNVAFTALQKLRIPGRDKQGSSYKYRANEIHCREDFGCLPGMKKKKAWMPLDTAGVCISAHTLLIWGTLKDKADTGPINQNSPRKGVCVAVRYVSAHRVPVIFLPHDF